MLHHLTESAPFGALFGSAPKPITSPVPARGDAILGILRGGEKADTLLDAISRGIGHPNALRDLVVSLASDPAALEGACRTVQKALESEANQ
jgi:hypothetical protein